MGLPPYKFELDVYTDDTKGTQLCTINNVAGVSRTLALMAPYQHSIVVYNTDKATGGITKGSYYELTLYTASTRQLWANGYVQNVQQDITRQNAYTITGASSLIHLANFRDLGHLDMDPHIFGNVVDVLNGVQHPGGSGIYPPGYKGILTGSGWTATWVDPNGSTAPGAGDYWRTDWATALLNVTTLAQHYNFYVRERAGSTAHNGVLEIGPLSDPMYPGSTPDTMTIWGGDNLRSDMVSSHPELGDLDRPNAAFAQQYGYAQVQEVVYSDDMAHIINLVWPIGAGSPDSGGTTLKPLVGGDPTGNGWSTWQPYSGGRLYYVKAASKVTYLGNTFEYVASQEQDGRWAYGVVNRGPSPGSGPPPYGVNEYVLTEKKIDDPEWLLSAALGHLEYNSDPVPSYTFTVKHPQLNVTDTPACPAPGNRINVNYAGIVHAGKWDTDATSATYGQFIADGSYTYLSYPGTADTNRIAKLKRVIQIDDQWSDAGYAQTLTLGRGKWHSGHWADALAKRMEHHQTKPNTGRGNSAKKQLWHNVNFAFSGSPHFAWENTTTNTVLMQPGAIVVSDTPDSNFFDQAHTVSFMFSITDTAQVLDFWFAKKIDSTVTGIASSQAYGLLRLAFSGSSVSSGFYSTVDGTSLTGRGTKLRCAAFNSSFRLAVGTYRGTVEWHGHPSGGNQFNAYLEFPDITMPSGIYARQRIAHWDDGSGGQTITTWGAIGWHLTGGSANATLLGLTAHANHPTHREKAGNGRAQEGNGKPAPRSYRVTSSNANRFGSIGVPKAETPL